MSLFKKKKKPDPGRNELCSCGSRLKFKDCHGDERKRMACVDIASKFMLNLIAQEQVHHNICPNCTADIVDNKCVNTEECGLEVVTQEEAQKRMQNRLVVPSKKLILPSDAG